MGPIGVCLGTRPAPRPWPRGGAALFTDYFHSPEESSRKISDCTSLQFPSARFFTRSSTVAAFVHPENRHETQLKTWQRRGRYIVTQSALAASNSVLGTVAFVKRQTMRRSVGGTEVDFHLLSADTRYLPFHRQQFEDKLSFSGPF